MGHLAVGHIAPLMPGGDLYRNLHLQQTLMPRMHLVVWHSDRNFHILQHSGWVVSCTGASSRLFCHECTSLCGILQHSSWMLNVWVGSGLTCKGTCSSLYSRASRHYSFDQYGHSKNS